MTRSTPRDSITARALPDVRSEYRDRGVRSRERRGPALSDAKHEGIDIGHPNYGSDGVEASGAEMVGRPGRREQRCFLVAGLDLAKLAFALIDPNIAVQVETDDGATVTTGGVIARIRGPARGILIAERTALNCISAE